MLLSGYVPLLFMGEEYGETNPFLYFVSHGDAALLDAVREGRRAEFADFAWGDGVPDPGDPATFVRSRLDHGRRCTPRGAALRALYRDALALRRSEPALRPGAADAVTRAAEDGQSGTLVLVPHAASARAVCLVHNLADECREIALPADVAGRTAPPWRRVLSTVSARYSGDDPATVASESTPDASTQRASVRMPPRAVELFVAGAAE